MPCGPGTDPAFPYRRECHWRSGPRRLRAGTTAGHAKADARVEQTAGYLSVWSSISALGTSRSVRSSETRARTGIRLVSSRRATLRHTREGDEQDIGGRPRVDHVVHFARSLDERLPRAVGGGLALAANRSVDGERARLHDDDCAARMRVPAGGAAGVDRDLGHGDVGSEL